MTEKMMTPFIHPDYAEELARKPIAKRHLIMTEEGYSPGHIIWLWRISFGSFTNQMSPHKYFYTTYGIDAVKELEILIEDGLVRVETAFESLRHLRASDLKAWLKEKHVTGLSKCKRADLDDLMRQYFSEEDLAELFEIRGYLLTPTGQELLEKYPEIVAKHPQKKY